ncbi:snf7 domain-containing protein [Phthorimaea operculella]|nr:snf7 domain-containing protein [Phthorimaea operculella]
MGLPENVIPADKLPQCWMDDVRMNALFAPFRIKSANPESWDMKMKFWSDMLRQWCKHKNDPVISASDAKFAFARKGRTPACLDIVVEEMIRSGELSPISKYTQILQNGPEGWVKWGARLAFKPAAFALTAAVSLLPARQALDSDGLPKASIDPTHRFVLESAVKEQAMVFIENYPPDEERIGTVEELLKRSGWSHGRDTLEVILGWLVAQGLATKKDEFIKLAEPNKKVSPITETDEALVKLLSAECRLAGDLARLEREVESCGAEAKAALQLGNRTAAKNHLRRKHKAQQRLDRCETALENVRQLLLQMKDVDTNSAIVDTYRTSSQAMKQGMKESGLDEDAVHDTMDDLKEVLQQYDDVTQALGGSAVVDYDTTELEQELKDLLASPTPAAVSPPRGKEKRTPEPAPSSSHWGAPEKIAVKPNDSKSWYPPSNQFLKDAWNNNPEVRQDTRIHPGQPLDIDFSTPPRLFGTDFQVRDYKTADGVWIYNKDTNSNLNDLAASTEYTSPELETPTKPPAPFQMAPGGERKASIPWTSEAPTRIGPPSVDDLEQRLKNLRGFNL